MSRTMIGGFSATITARMLKLLIAIAVVPWNRAFAQSAIEAVEFLVTSDSTNIEDTSQHFIVRIYEADAISQARAEVEKTEGPWKIISGVVEKEAVEWNPGWSFHILPETVIFGEIFIGTCSFSIAFLEENLEDVGGSVLPDLRWCPWSSRVLEELGTVIVTDESTGVAAESANASVPTESAYPSIAPTSAPTLTDAPAESASPALRSSLLTDSPTEAPWILTDKPTAGAKGRQGGLLTDSPTEPPRVLTDTPTVPPQGRQEEPFVDFLITTDNFDLTNTDQYFVVRITNPVAIADARLELEKDSGWKIISGTIVDETAPWNPDWSYHLIPSSIEFAELFFEVCDANAVYVEENLADVGGAFLPNNFWCPWGSAVLEELGSSDDTAVPTTLLTDAPVSSPPTAVAFPTEAPVSSPPVVEDCLGETCTPGNAEDCSCRPGLECRRRTSGDGLSDIEYRCSAVSKTVKNRISSTEGVGGAGGGGGGREPRPKASP